jgi:hypothetical protein
VQLLRYLWAFPATGVGLVFVLAAWRARVVDGVIEVQGGLVSAFLRRGFLAWNLPGNSSSKSARKRQSG